MAVVVEDTIFPLYEYGKSDHPSQNRGLKFQARDEKYHGKWSQSPR